MSLFHRHKFGPEKWKQISSVSVRRIPAPLDPVFGVPQSTEPYAAGKIFVFSNTCTQCGDIVFRHVKEIE